MSRLRQSASYHTLRDVAATSPIGGGSSSIALVLATSWQPATRKGSMSPIGECPDRERLRKDWTLGQIDKVADSIILATSWRRVKVG